MRGALILGAGGHAQVVADILLCANAAGSPVRPIGFLDDDPSLQGQQFLGLSVLGVIDQHVRIGHDLVIIGIGDNRTRRRLFEEFSARGEQFAIARHPSAIIASDVLIGSGSVICAGVVVNTGSVIGMNTILNTACTIDHHNRIGDHVHVAPGTHLGGEVRVGEGALIGIGATILPRCSVGAWSVVGGGACVVGAVPSGVIVTGVPARLHSPQIGQ